MGFDDQKNVFGKRKTDEYFSKSLAFSFL